MQTKVKEISFAHDTEILAMILGITPNQIGEHFEQALSAHIKVQMCRPWDLPEHVAVANRIMPTF